MIRTLTRRLSVVSWLFMTFRDFAMILFHTLLSETFFDFAMVMIADIQLRLGQ